MAGKLLSRRPDKRTVSKPTPKRVPMQVTRSGLKKVLSALGFSEMPGASNVFVSRERRTTVQIPTGNFVTIEKRPALRGLVGEYVRAGGKL